MRRMLSLLSVALPLLSLPAWATEPPKNNAEEQAWAAAAEANVAAGYTAYLNEFPKGRYAATARIKLAILGKAETTNAAPGTATPPPAAPATPKSAVQAETPPPAVELSASAPAALPFEISDSLWQQIVQSELYRNAPRAHAVEARYTESTNSRLTLMNSVSTTTQQFRSVGPVPQGPRALTQVLISNETVGRMNHDKPSAPSKASSRSYGIGGLLELGSLDGDGKLVGKTDRIDRLEGSLFPPKAGASIHISFHGQLQSEYATDYQVDATCTLSEAVEASTLAPVLKGKAWPVACTKTHRSFGKYGSSFTNQSHDYLLEDLGIFAATVGVVDLNTMTTVLPVGQSYRFPFVVGESKTDHLIEGYSLVVLD